MQDEKNQLQYLRAELLKRQGRIQEAKLAFEKTLEEAISRADAEMIHFCQKRLGELENIPSDSSNVK